MINPDVLLRRPSGIVLQPCSAAGSRRPPSWQRRTSGWSGGHQGSPGATSPLVPPPGGHRPADRPERPGGPAASRCRCLEKKTFHQETRRNGDTKHSTSSTISDPRRTWNHQKEPSVLLHYDETLEVPDFCWISEGSCSCGCRSHVRCCWSSSACWCEQRGGWYLSPGLLQG